MIVVHENDTRRPPSDGATDNLPPCKNCGEAFEDHMQDGEPLFMCHYEHQQQAMYGGFNGGDPRDFHPDYECSTPEERENHKRACAEAERLESARELPCPSGWIGGETDGQQWTAHVFRCPFGLGITTFPPTCYEV